MAVLNRIFVNGFALRAVIRNTIWREEVTTTRSPTTNCSKTTSLTHSSTHTIQANEHDCRSLK